LVHIIPALPYSGVQWAEWVGNVGQLIKKLANLYKKKLIEHNKNMAESEKTPLAFTMYDSKLSNTDTLYKNEKRNTYRVLVGTPEGKEASWKTWM
jgi:hypothetical protein